MKLTKSKLKQIIKEALMKEGWATDPGVKKKDVALDLADRLLTLLSGLQDVPSRLKRAEKLDLLLPDMIEMAGNIQSHVQSVDASDTPRARFALEEEKKEAKDNPRAICTASVGRKDKEKYESCVKKVKGKKK